MVIHEWWGLNDWVKEEASKLADQGYVTLAIDLYRGKVATTPDEAHEIMRGVPEDRANRDLLAASAYLRSQKNVDPKRVGSIGWCMGGGYSLDLAIADPKLKVAVINYGHLATDDATLKKINAAILGIFGGQDKGIPPETVKKFEAQLHALGKWRRSTFSLMRDTRSRILIISMATGPATLHKRGSTRSTFWPSI